MKIGLVRHFDVECRKPAYWRLITPGQFAQWLDDYEIADIIQGDQLPNMIKWDKCYTSDLPRAAKTAKYLYNGPIIETEMLREIVISPPTKRNIRLPIMMWLVMGRVAWMLSHKSQPESKVNFKKRIEHILEELILKDDANVLIISHGALMMFLRKELLKRGFIGPNFHIAKNGELYVFEKPEYGA